jgi:hypothetical protein
MYKHLAKYQARYNYIYTTYYTYLLFYAFFALTPLANLHHFLIYALLIFG